MPSPSASLCSRHQHARDSLHLVKPRLCLHQTVTARPPSPGPRHPPVSFCPCECDSSGGLAEVTLSGLSCGWPVALSIMSSEDPSTFHKNAELPWAGRGQGQGGGGTPSSSPTPSPVGGDLASPPQLAGCRCRIHVAFRGAGFALTLEGQQGAQGGGQGVSQAEEGAGATLHRCRCGRPPTARAGRGPRVTGERGRRRAWPPRGPS